MHYTMDIPLWLGWLLPVTSSFSFMANSYWSIVVSTTWHHCRWSAARRQAEWTPVLKCWTSRDTILNRVSRVRTSSRSSPSCRRVAHSSHHDPMAVFLIMIFWPCRRRVEAFSCALTWRQRNSLRYFSLPYLCHYFPCSKTDVGTIRQRCRQPDRQTNNVNNNNNSNNSRQATCSQVALQSGRWPTLATRTVAIDRRPDRRQTTDAQPQTRCLDLRVAYSLQLAN